MPEPAADHVDLDASLQQVHGGRVPKDVGPDSADDRVLVLKTRGVPPDELVNAESQNATATTRRRFCVSFRPRNAAMSRGERRVSAAASGAMTASASRIGVSSARAGASSGCSAAAPSSRDASFGDAGES